MTTNERFYVRPFGLDCLGNCSGWLVCDNTKNRQNDNPVVAHFVGNIYKPEQRKASPLQAFALAAKLNLENGDAQPTY